ncbi:MAG TPA: hydrolase [Candidatus Nitrosotenuis sp.]|nr:hydrolase [Candidatus Nitrosotenuis sp.]
MSTAERDKDELIRAQNELIGILFEIIKRMQANNNLDEEYFQLVSGEKQKESNSKRLEEILAARQENSKIISRLLEKIQS